MGASAVQPMPASISVMKRIHSCVFASAVSALAFTAVPAQAQQAERGLCLPNAEMTARLRNEGQRSIVTGEAVMVDGVSVSRPLGIVYSTNASGNRGYQLSGERGPNNEPPATMCIDEVLTNIRLANPSYRRVPDSFYAPNGITREEAREIAEREGVTPAGSLNDSMDFAAVNSEGFPIMQAQIVTPSETWHTVTIINLPASNSGVAYHSRDRGFHTTRYVMLESRLAPYAQELLKDRPFRAIGR